ncbi:hypothetical protein H6G52_16575 [Limnothrix sp. FACHB-881]|uniref:hypothetical protein n=1 Tax=Limnothrix sp. FACHB-881 TaxID=2692819 RepID=UPI001685F79F|nr:hypothetical protein [Limnothrix sp. FACHB-881]MBD2636986.1 hypothetical protein [Limnothrix sp. FACHB-881]
MRVSEICKSRQILTINTSTPIIIPSFSSRGFPFIEDIYNNTKRYLSKSSLISAYDIHYGNISQDDIYSSDILFIDSGGYEAKPVSDLTESYVDGRLSNGWSTDYYEAVLERLQPLSRLVIVNYDYSDPHPISTQVNLAKKLFQKYPNYAANFLYKPEDGKSLINLGTLTNNIQLIEPFSILGITEKELGGSLFERCCNLLQIRTALLEIGLETPIHIFGCLDPATMVIYFLCGADVFDGLAWLRYTFDHGFVAYHSTATVLKKQWCISEEDLLLTRWISNLEYLEALTRSMKKFCKTGLINEFCLGQSLLTQVLCLVKLTGIEFEGGS